MKKAMVLLVEDNHDNREIYRTYLRFHGYQVTDTANGTEALEIAVRDRPDLVLLDLSIPGMDGITLTRHLKDSPDTGAIPVIALTAHALPEHRERAREAGCDGYLTKPISPSKVLEEIRRLLPGTGTSGDGSEAKERPGTEHGPQAPETA